MHLGSKNRDDPLHIVGNALQLSAGNVLPHLIHNLFEPLSRFFSSTACGFYWRLAIEATLFAKEDRFETQLKETEDGLLRSTKNRVRG